MFRSSRVPSERFEPESLCPVLLKVIEVHVRCLLSLPCRDSNGDDPLVGSLSVMPEPTESWNRFPLWSTGAALGSTVNRKEKPVTSMGVEPSDVMVTLNVEVSPRVLELFQTEKRKRCALATTTIRRMWGRLVSTILWGQLSSVFYSLSA